MQATCQIIIYIDVVRILEPCNPKFLRALKVLDIEYDTLVQGSYDFYPTDSTALRSIINLAQLYHDFVQVEHIDDSFWEDDDDQTETNDDGNDGSDSYDDNATHSNHNAINNPWEKLKKYMSKDEYSALRKILAKRYHPDHGGDSTAMQEINKLLDELGA